MCLGHCPYDILYLVLEEACTLDTGKTVRALSLTSRHISSIALPFLYRTLSLHGVSQIQRARNHLLELPVERRNVHNLLISDLTTDYLNIPSTATSADPLGRAPPVFQLRGQPGAEQAHRFQDEIDSLIPLVVPTLRTFACLTRNPWQRFIFSSPKETSFPHLTSLILSQHSRVPFRPQENETDTSLCMPQLRRLHLSYGGTGYIDFQVQNIVQLFAHGCPQLSQLRLSDVDFYLGGKNALIYMLSEMTRAAEDGGGLGTSAHSMPPNVKTVLMQTVKNMRPKIEEEDMRALRAICERFPSYLILDDTRLPRTFDQWTEEWLKVARGSYDAWEYSGRCWRHA